MKVKDLKFKITDANGESIVIGFDDLYGYEGEVCGVLIRYDTIENQNDKFGTTMVNYNSGYGFRGLDEDFAECDVEIVEE